MIELVPLSMIDTGAVERLLDRAFGPERRARTAYRIRSGSAEIPGLSFAALAAGDLVGSIQCWPIALHGDGGSAHRLIMLGPVAVVPERQRGGIGRQLTERAIAVADERHADEPLMLIGDPEYYGRFFGFTADATGDWAVPGPVERRRLLARGAAVPAVPGVLGPRWRAAA
jgi:predicted N-acetyltransferase YhbS